MRSESPGAVADRLYDTHQVESISRKQFKAFFAKAPVDDRQELVRSALLEDAHLAPQVNSGQTTSSGKKHRRSRKEPSDVTKSSKTSAKRDKRGSRLPSPDSSQLHRHKSKTTSTGDNDFEVKLQQVCAKFGLRDPELLWRKVGKGSGLAREYFLHTVIHAPRRDLLKIGKVLRRMTRPTLRQRRSICSTKQSDTEQAPAPPVQPAAGKDKDVPEEKVPASQDDSSPHQALESYITKHDFIVKASVRQSAAEFSNFLQDVHTHAVKCGLRGADAEDYVGHARERYKILQDWLLMRQGCGAGAEPFSTTSKEPPQAFRRNGPGHPGAPNGGKVTRVPTGPKAAQVEAISCGPSIGASATSREGRQVDSEHGPRKKGRRNRDRNKQGCAYRADRSHQPFSDAHSHDKNHPQEVEHLDRHRSRRKSAQFRQRHEPRRDAEFAPGKEPEEKTVEAIVLSDDEPEVEPETSRFWPDVADESVFPLDEPTIDEFWSPNLALSRTEVDEPFDAPFEQDDALAMLAEDTDHDMEPDMHRFERRLTRTATPFHGLPKPDSSQNTAEENSQATRQFLETEGVDLRRKDKSPRKTCITPGKATEERKAPATAALATPPKSLLAKSASSSRRRQSSFSRSTRLVEQFRITDSRVRLRSESTPLRQKFIRTSPFRENEDDPDRFARIRDNPFSSSQPERSPSPTPLQKGPATKAKRSPSKAGRQQEAILPNLPPVPPSAGGGPYESPLRVRNWAAVNSKVRTPKPANSINTEPSVATPKKRMRSELQFHYFEHPSPPKRRPTAAAGSSIVFPSIHATSFGLIQEELAADPFRLLVAVTFLNRTKGAVAIPVFRTLMARYPTPAALAEAPTAIIAEHIQTLGLQNSRAKTLSALARFWCEQPPQRGQRYRTLHYPYSGAGRNILGHEMLSDDSEDPRIGALEIAHLPGVGPYAFDSWRIFCRDVLRGLADGWNGENADDEEFEPEWKRVIPRDKELKAFLRWMWLKEGWIWDPMNGEKRVPTDEEVVAAREGGCDAVMALSQPTPANTLTSSDGVEAANGSSLATTGRKARARSSAKHRRRAASPELA